MYREAIATGATVQEAQEAAKLMLGVSESDSYEIEIIDLPEKKTFGIFGGKKAKVRVYIGNPEEKDKPVAEEKPAEAESKPAKPAKRQKNADKPAKKQETAPKSDASEETSDRAEKKSPRASNVPSAADMKQGVESAVAYLKAILEAMNITGFTVEVKDIEDGCEIDIEGENLGVIIGRRGETLDALQYLVSLACNADNDGGFYRVVLNTGNYREKREKTLEALAQKCARQALRTGRNQSLEPMNPYERRIIHTAVQAIEGVTSWSVSDGKNRRVVIGTDKDADVPTDRAGMSRGRGDRRGGRGPRSRGGRPAYQAAVDPNREKVSDSAGVALYGRIDK